MHQSAFGLKLSVWPITVLIPAGHDCPLLCLGAGTPHKPAVITAKGHVLHEASAYTEYLVAQVGKCFSSVSSASCAVDQFLLVNVDEHGKNLLPCNATQHMTMGASKCQMSAAATYLSSISEALRASVIAWAPAPLKDGFIVQEELKLKLQEVCT